MLRRAVRYGPRRGQTADLWRPAGVDGPLPVVVLLHGGFWRSRYTKVLMTRLARSVKAHGWAAWNVEYRRVGILGGGGGWPATVAERYHLASPVERLPLGVAQVLVHGTADTVVPVAMSESSTARAAAAGDAATFVPVDGAGHRDMITPNDDGWRAALPHLARLLAP